MHLDFRATASPHQPIPDSLNLLSGRVIGCGIEVHRRLGPGLLEHVYDRAMCVELAHCGLKFLRQVATPMVYRDVVVAEFRLDLLVEGELVVEIKSVQTPRRRVRLAGPHLPESHQPTTRLDPQLQLLDPAHRHSSRHPVVRPTESVRARLRSSTMLRPP
jgi:GxxExxY protein